MQCWSQECTKPKNFLLNPQCLQLSSVIPPFEILFLEQERGGKSLPILLPPSKLQPSAPDADTQCYTSARHGLFTRAARLSARIPPGGREQLHHRGTDRRRCFELK